jgi:ABC-2 type transport system permease protein
MIPALIRNETLKILRRRRFAIVIGILAAILMLISYAEYRQLRNQKQREWRVELQQRVAGYQNALRRGRVSDTGARFMRAEIARLQFYLDHDICRCSWRCSAATSSPPNMRKGPTSCC